MPSVDRVMAEQRAASFTKRSLKGDTKPIGLRLALSMVDLTTLEGKDTLEKARSLARKAVWPGGPGDGELPTVGAVCVYPTMVAATRKELNRLGPRGEAVKVAAVATGFPSGQYPLKVRLDDTRRAVEAGADEIDMVISRGAFLSGERQRVYDEIRATIEACGWREEFAGAADDHAFAHLKVILETGELETLDNVRAASDIAIRALHDSGLSAIPGAGFIKTSTGKVDPAATMPVTLVMLEAIRDHYLATGELVGMKPAGGIRTAKQALHYLVMLKETLGAIPGEDGREGVYLSPRLFRFGASALVNDLLKQIQWCAGKRYAARYDVSEA